MKRLTGRPRFIILVLQGLNGEATTRQIAQSANLNVNGVAQSLGRLSDYVRSLGGKGGDTKWELKSEEMTVRLYVYFKPGVPNDPLKATQAKLAGCTNVSALNQGKYFEIRIKTRSRREAGEIMRRLCKKVFGNGWYEDCRFDIMP